MENKPSRPPLSFDFKDKTDHFAWGFALLPLVWSVFVLLFARGNTVVYLSLYILFIIAEIYLITKDRILLKNAGFSTPSMWWFLVYVGYLLSRYKKKTNNGRALLLVSSVSILMSFYAGHSITTGFKHDLQKQAVCKTITGIMRQNNIDRECIKVDSAEIIVEGRLYSGTAMMDDATHVRFTAKSVGDNGGYEVTIPDVTAHE